MAEPRFTVGTPSREIRLADTTSMPAGLAIGTTGVPSGLASGEPMGLRPDLVT